MSKTRFSRLSLLPSLAREAGKIISDPKYRVLEKTKLNALDLATQGDMASEKYLMDTIRQHFPEDKIMSEETANEVSVSGDEYLWVLDPIDGTTNYAKGRSYSAVSIGLIQHDEIVAGVAFNPFVNELYSAERGKGAFLNGKKIHCSVETDLSKSVFITDTGYTPDVMRDHYDTLFKLSELSRVFSGGSAVMQMCEVAAGRFEAYFNTIHKPWDNAAAFLILHEAGAVTVDRQGNEVDWHSPEVFTGNPELVKKCVSVFKT